MIKLTSKRMEEIVKQKIGKDVIYLGVFVDANYQTIKPVKHGFVDRNSKKFKLISVLEKQIIQSL